MMRRVESRVESELLLLLLLRLRRLQRQEPRVDSKQNFFEPIRLHLTVGNTTVSTNRLHGCANKHVLKPTGGAGSGWHCSSVAEKGPRARAKSTVDEPFDQSFSDQPVFEAEQQQ
ncbi:MAG: hypothetical protein P4M11_01220 [Candidatus Pacebacteria bacterium]|nr:hypothetical protein [Candidatus Paceibacterota bacterium]